MNKKKQTIISIAMATMLLGSMGYEIIKEKEQIDKLNNEKKIMIEKYEKEYDMLNKKYKDSQKELDYYKSDEYIESIKLSKLQKATGLDVKGYYKENFKFTYYTALPSENGGYTVTCNGEPLVDGIVASNYYPQGTKLYIDGKVYTVADRGSSRFNSPNRLDVFVGKYGGESSGEYLRRVNNMGVKNTEGFVLEI